MKPIGQNQNKTHSFLASPWTTISLFLVLIVSSLGYLYLSNRASRFRGEPLEESYLTLKLSVKKGGLSQFQKDKDELKEHLQSVLKSPKNEEEEINALNIALYLFPEILPDSNLEKQFAMDSWAPLEAAIEKKPRTAEARMLFEELTSNIWNYENPKLKNVGLSLYASETLSIYHELSSP